MGVMYLCGVRSCLDFKHLFTKVSSTKMTQMVLFRISSLLFLYFSSASPFSFFLSFAQSPTVYVSFAYHKIALDIQLCFANPCPNYNYNIFNAYASTFLILLSEKQWCNQDFRKGRVHTYHNKDNVIKK